MLLVMPVLVFRVKLAALPVLWTDVAYMLRDDPNLDLNKLQKDLLLGKRQLWLVVTNPHHTASAAILTEKHKYPPVKLRPRGGRPRPDDFPDRWNIPERQVLVIHLAGRTKPIPGASIGTWIDTAVKVIEEFARSLGCNELRIICRLGWKLYAKRFGQGFNRITFRRDRLTLWQWRRKARGLGVEWQGGTRTGMPL
jgi:hypothetical protein